jgi:hypothetical protein
LRFTPSEAATIRAHAKVAGKHQVCAMTIAKKTIVRDFRVTVTVEEIEAPKMTDAPNSKEFWKSEVDEFLEDADYETK